MKVQELHSSRVFTTTEFNATVEDTANLRAEISEALDLINAVERVLDAKSARIHALETELQTLIEEALHE